MLCSLKNSHQKFLLWVLHVRAFRGNQGGTWETKKVETDSSSLSWVDPQLRRWAEPPSWNSMESKKGVSLFGFFFSKFWRCYVISITINSVINYYVIDYYVIDYYVIDYYVINYYVIDNYVIYYYVIWLSLDKYYIMTKLGWKWTIQGMKVDGSRKKSGRFNEYFYLIGLQSQTYAIFTLLIIRLCHWMKWRMALLSKFNTAIWLVGVFSVKIVNF